MKIEIKNKELLIYLNILNGFNNIEANVKCLGLRHEAVTLGVKVRLSKISKELVKNLEEFENAKKAKINEVYVNGITPEIEKQAIIDNDENYMKLVKEINESGEEIVSMDVDVIDLSKVEDVVTDYDYSFFLEKFAI